MFTRQPKERRQTVLLPMRVLRRRLTLSVLPSQPCFGQRKETKRRGMALALDQARRMSRNLTLFQRSAAFQRWWSRPSVARQSGAAHSPFFSLHDPRSPTVTSSQQFRLFGTGTRGSRGHGWFHNFRAGLGGRHLQGDHWDFPALEEKNEWNDKVFELSNKDGIERVFLDVQIQDKVQQEESDANTTSEGSLSQPTRLEVELAAFATPETCRNFKLLCQDRLYVNSQVNRMEKSVGWVMGSLTTRGINMKDDGPDADVPYSTNKRLVGHCHPSLSDTHKLYQEDSLVLWHVPGVVTMLSPHVNEIDSRFVVCTDMAPQLDGRHVPFGRLTSESLQFLQETSIFTKRGVPTVDVVVVDCGVLGGSTTVPTKAEDDTPVSA